MFRKQPTKMMNIERENRKNYIRGLPGRHYSICFCFLMITKLPTNAKLPTTVVRFKSLLCSTFHGASYEAHNNSCSQLGNVGALRAIKFVKQAVRHGDKASTV